MTSKPLQVATVKIVKKLPVWIGHYRTKFKADGRVQNLTVFEPTDGQQGEELYVDGDRFCWMKRHQRLWPARLLGQAIGPNPYMSSPECVRADLSRIRPFDNAIAHGLLVIEQIDDDYPDDAGFATLQNCSESRFRELKMNAEIVRCNDFDATEWRAFAIL